MVLQSWLRAFMAGTLMVDGHGLNGWPEILVFLSVVLSLGFFSFAYYRLWVNSALSIPDIKALAFISIIIFSFMLPMLSNDIFSYLVFGDAANKGIDVYTNPQCTHFSTYFPYITNAWASSTCAYGSVTLWLAMTSALAGSGKILLALIAYKILILLFAFAFVEVASRVCVLMQSPARCLTFIVLNPVFLLQGVGQLHADLVAITFILAGIYFLLTNKWYLAFVMVALAIATKMNYVLVLPFFIVALFIQEGIPATTLKKTGAGLMILLATIVLVYAPFYTSTATITTPFKFHFFQNPSKCIGEVLSYVVYYVPQLLSGHQLQLSEAANNTSGPGTQVYISNFIVKICQAFAVCASLYILIKFVFGKRAINQWFRVYLRALLLFLLYYMHIFNPWYLMMFLPFLWVIEEAAFIHWLLVLTCFISVQDVVCIVDRNSFVYITELALTFMSVMLYLYRPRYVFFTSLGY